MWRNTEINAIAEWRPNGNKRARETKERTSRNNKWERDIPHIVFISKRDAEHACHSFHCIDTYYNADSFQQIFKFVIFAFFFSSCLHRLRHHHHQQFMLRIIWKHSLSSFCSWCIFFPRECATKYIINANMAVKKGAKEHEKKSSVTMGQPNEKERQIKVK